MVGIPKLQERRRRSATSCARQGRPGPVLPRPPAGRRQLGTPARRMGPGGSSSRPSRPTTSSGSLLVRPTNKLARVSLTYPEIDGIGGKGAALRTIFEIAAALEVQALVVVDSDLRSIGPEWIELLAGPILKGGYDYAAPLYARQARRDDHQQRHLPADPRALRAAHPPADRRRLRRVRRSRPPLPRGRPLDTGGFEVRDRHLDDHARARRRVRDLPGPASARRSTIPRIRAPISGRCSARPLPRSSGWPSRTSTAGRA